MVKRSELLSLSYYELAAFTGSDGTLRYRIEKKTDGEETQLCATAWNGPFAFDHTPDEEKRTRTAEFGEEGLQELVDWLNGSGRSAL